MDLTQIYLIDKSIKSLTIKTAAKDLLHDFYGEKRDPIPECYPCLLIRIFTVVPINL